MTYLLHEFFYVIRDKRNGMLYAGSKFSKKDSYPELFMTPDGYQTSSPTIKQIIDECGLETFEIVKLKLVDNAYDYETRFLKKVDAKNNPRFYNAHNNEKLSFGTEEFEDKMLKTYGVSNANYIPEIKAKAVANMTATKNDPEWRRTIGAGAIEKRMAVMDYVEVGRKQSETKNSEEWIKEIGNASAAKMSATKLSEEWRNTVGAGAIEKRMAVMDYVEVGNKISDTITTEEWKSLNYKTCEHCHKTEINPGNYSRWHGDNCKLKPILIQP